MSERRHPDASTLRGVSDRETLDAPALQADQLGLVVVDRGYYAIGAELARGGMGRIFTAHDLRLGREVAIKELIAQDDDARVRFDREARITARLQHPSIVNIHEAGVWNTGEPFYVMKRVAGDPLDVVITRARTRDARLALLPNVLAVADALAYAHRQRVIHRDLKPGNVLVGEFGETVVIDWGLAKDLAAIDTDVAYAPRSADDSAPGETVAGAVLGTPSYMPPEQALGAVVDETSDVYALGAILYHALCGRAPFTGPTAATVLAQVVAGPPPPLPADLPPDLVAIVDKAMARAPADRYPDAAGFAADLRRFQTGQLVGVHHYSTGELVRRWLRKNRGIVAVAALALVVVAAGGAVAIQRIVAANRVAQGEADNARRQAAEASRQEAIATQQTAVLLREQGRQELLAGRADRAATLLAATYRGPGDHVGQVLLGAAFEKLHRQTVTVAVAELPWHARFEDQGQTVAVTRTADGPTERYSAATGARLDDGPSWKSELSVVDGALRVARPNRPVVTIPLPAMSDDPNIYVDARRTIAMVWDKRVVVAVAIDAGVARTIESHDAKWDVAGADVSDDGTRFMAVSSGLGETTVTIGDPRDPTSPLDVQHYRGGMIDRVSIDPTATEAFAFEKWTGPHLLFSDGTAPMPIPGFGQPTAAVFVAPNELAIADERAIVRWSRYGGATSVVAAVDAPVVRLVADGNNLLAVSSANVRSFRLPTALEPVVGAELSDVTAVSDDGSVVRRRDERDTDVAVRLAEPKRLLGDVSLDGATALRAREWFANPEWVGRVVDGTVQVERNGANVALTGCAEPGSKHVWLAADGATALCTSNKEMRRWAGGASAVIGRCKTPPAIVASGGSHVVYTCDGPKLLDASEAGALATALPPGMYSLSPDGAHLIAVRDGHIEVSPAAGGPALPAFGSGIHMATERSGVVYAMGEDGGLSLWDAQLGVLLHQIANDAPSTMVASPHGTTMAVVIGNFYRIFPVPLETRSPAEVTAEAERLSGWRLDGGRLVRK